VQLPVSVLGEGGIEIDVTALDEEGGGETATKSAPAADNTAESNE
jgi:hypothetical protein